MFESDKLEGQLVKIWESLLGRQGIRVQDNFWELGGHSLMAVRMMHHIDETVGKDLPIEVLLQAPSIAKLARLIRQSSFPPSTSLIALKTSGSRPPLFCVHGIGGLIVRFRDLARYLAPEHPLYALQAQGVDGKHPPLGRIEDMAAHYLEEIRTVQPRGPYYLGGLSFGGWIAYEMAQQLRSRGEEVGLLVLFDTFRENQSTQALVLKLLRLPPRASFAYVFQKASGLWAGSLRHRIFRPPLPLPLNSVGKALYSAWDAYVPQPYLGKVTFFRPRLRSLRSSDGPSAGWRDLAGGELEIYEVPGDHNNMLEEPQVRVLARQLNACLDKSRQAGSPTSIREPTLTPTGPCAERG